MTENYVPLGDGVYQYQTEDRRGVVTWTDECDEIEEWHAEITLDDGSRFSGVHCVVIDRESHMRRDIGPEHYDDWTSAVFWFNSEEEAHTFFEIVRKARSITIGDEDYRMPYPLSKEEQDELIKRFRLDKEVAL